MRWGRGAKRTSWSNFLKCCCEAEGDGVQVTTVAVLVLGLASVVDNLVRWIWEASDGANRGCCSFAATLAVEETFPTRGLWHDVHVFHWCDTTEASKDHLQLRTGSSRRRKAAETRWPKSLRTLLRGVAVCSQVLMHEGYVFLLTNSTERAPA